MANWPEEPRFRPGVARLNEAVVPVGCRGQGRALKKRGTFADYQVVFLKGKALGRRGQLQELKAAGSLLWRSCTMGEDDGEGTELR